MKRDFTYIDDIVEGIVRLIPTVPSGSATWDGNQPDPASSFAPYRIYNIGNNKPVELMQFIELIENKLGKKAIKNLLPIQEGDVPATYADVDDLIRDVGFKPETPIESGINNFIDWYIDYYKVGK
jgi:UDP-glucuronate 4-epimerase